MYQRYKGRGKYTYKRMQNKITRLFQAREGKQSAFNCITVEQDRRSTINVIIRRVRVTIVTVENQ